MSCGAAKRNLEGRVRERRREESGERGGEEEHDGSGPEGGLLQAGVRGGYIIVRAGQEGSRHQDPEGGRGGAEMKNEKNDLPKVKEGNQPENIKHCRLVITPMTTTKSRL